MAFHFPRNPRKSIYGGKYTKDRYSSFVFPATCSPSISPNKGLLKVKLGWAAVEEDLMQLTSILRRVQD
jgi:hypothetical protein